MDLLASFRCADAKLASVLNVAKNAQAIRSKTEEEFQSKTEKHFLWLSEILQEIQSTLAK